MGYNDGNADYGLGYSKNSFGGKTSQNVVAYQLQIGDFGFRLDEDMFANPTGDKFRTGGALFSYKVNDDLTLAFGGSMITGWAKGSPIEGPANYNNSHSSGGLGLHRPEEEFMGSLRGGILYGGAIYKGQSFFAGHNSEKRLHSIQNFIHYNMNKTNGTPYFPNRNLPSKYYGHYGGYNANYLYY